MADNEANRTAAERDRQHAGEAPRPPSVLPMEERRTRMRRAVWYSIIALLVVAGLMTPFFFET